MSSCFKKFRKFTFLGLFVLVLSFCFVSCQSPELEPLPTGSPDTPSLDPLVPEPSDPNAACVVDRFQQEEEPSSSIRKVDILFVMDTSGSMEDDWARVANNIRRLANELNPEVHIRIGVLLGHVGSLRGKLFSGRRSSGKHYPKVFDTTRMSMEEISQALFDTFQDGITYIGQDIGSGEATFYSLYHALTTELSNNKALGFFRDDAALSIVFMSDEHEIGSVFPIRANVPPRCDAAFEENIKKRYYHPIHLDADNLVGFLEEFKGLMPVSAHAFVNITIEDLFKNNDRSASCLYDSLGYGYFDIVSQSDGVLYSLQDDRSEGMERIGIAVNRDLQLVHRFQLSRPSSLVDPDSIKANVDSVEVSHRYDSGTSIVYLANAGRAGSLIEIKHCKPEEKKPEPVEWDINNLMATTGVEDLSASWDTGNVPTKAVFYLGLRKDNLSDRTVPILGFSTRHAVLLEGLEANTRYFFKVRATDKNGVVKESAVLSAVTKPGKEKPKPWEINNLIAKTGVEDLSASWDTGNVPTKAVFYLGLRKDDLKHRRVSIPGFSLRHKVLLEGLEANTRYFFKVKATDKKGVVRESAVLSAVTKAAEDPPPPADWSIVGLDGATTSTSLSIIWRTPNVRTTAVVKIGLSAEDLSLRSVAARRALSTHVLKVEGLGANTRYFFQVIAKDARGSERSSEIISKVTKSKGR